MNVSNNTDFFQVVDNFAITKEIESICVFKGILECEAKVTISIPTYKRVDTLKETLESALNQRGYDSYSIYVIDNNPERDDETEIFMQNYKGGRISYYKNSLNMGLCGNWNRCLSLPQTEWVCLLHDDDTITMNFLSEMMPYLEKLPNIGILQSRKYRNRNKHVEQKYSFPYERYTDLDFYIGNAIDVPTGMIINREKAISLGGYNQDYFPSLDSAFAAFMSSKYNTFVINKELTWYREGDENVSKAVETQKGWMIVDYYLTNYILKRYKIPSRIAEIYTEFRSVCCAMGNMKKWGTSFDVPYNQLPWKNHSKLFGRLLSHIFLRLFNFRHYLMNKLMFI